ncbi:hypothetical protein ISCGN_030180 [Ixodes scapularis]
MVCYLGMPKCMTTILPSSIGNAQLVDSTKHHGGIDDGNKTTGNPRRTPKAAFQQRTRKDRSSSFLNWPSAGTTRGKDWDKKGYEGDICIVSGTNSGTPSSNRRRTDKQRPLAGHREENIDPTRGHAPPLSCLRDRELGTECTIRLLQRRRRLQATSDQAHTQASDII